MKLMSMALRKHKIYLYFCEEIFNECSHVLLEQLSDTIDSEIQAHGTDTFYQIAL